MLKRRTSSLDHSRPHKEKAKDIHADNRSRSQLRTLCIQKNHNARMR
jgi:hypothetical protein